MGSESWCDGYQHHFSWSDDSYSQGHTVSDCPGPDKCPASKLTKRQVNQRESDQTLPEYMRRFRKNLTV